jgi:hypothetical protein
MHLIFLGWQIKKLVVPYQIDPDYRENESNEALVLLGTAMTWMRA